MNKIIIYILSFILIFNSFIYAKSNHKINIDNSPQSKLIKENPAVTVIAIWLFTILLKNKLEKDEDKTGNDIQEEDETEDDIQEGEKKEKKKRSSGIWGNRKPPKDSDGDGVIDKKDKCYGHDDNIDTDLDGVPDGCDKCEGHDDKIDTDSDGIADGCDKCIGGKVDYCGVCNGNNDTCTGCTEDPKACNYKRNAKIKEDCTYQYECRDDDQTQVCTKSQCPIIEYKEYWPDESEKVVGQYKDGIKYGTWTWKSNSKQTIIEQGKYKNGKKTGEWKTFYLSGREKTIIEYKNGKKHGSFRELDDFDKIIQLKKGSYKNGLKHGKWKEHYPTGNIKSSGTYNRGKKDLKWEEFYDNKKNEFNKRKQLSNYKNGTIVGDFIVWHDTENVQKKIEGQYNQKGQEIGIWIKWFENGKIESKSYYDNYNKKINLWFSNYENGNKKTEIKYQNNKKIEETRYHENGKTKLTGKYKNGKKDRKWRFYDEDGSLMEIIIYEDGEIIDTQKFDNSKNMFDLFDE